MVNFPTKIINIGEYSFTMIKTKEEEGYYLTHCEYDLYFKDKKISTNVTSIKSCYAKAYDFLKETERI